MTATTGAGSAPVVEVQRFRGRDIIVQFGASSTPITFQASIKRFLAAYLGSDENPVPFGGRDAEIKALNEWLASERSGNLLVTAPAGRGKTALLVHWVEQLAPTWPIAFIPISIRYESNRAAMFYQALAARLASVLGESLPATPTDPARFYKEKVIEYFDRFETAEKNCLVVIDGLDEATGWQVDPSVLPPLPPRGLKVVASARQLAGDRGSEDWLRRLGWRRQSGRVGTIEVLPLTRAGIADVLQRMGFPLAHLAQDVDLIGELFRLTEGGDPLLLGLYVEDLWGRGQAAARLSARDLAALQPGFGAYFRDWFEQQRRVWEEEGLHFDEEALNVILALLSCALGPIKLAVVGEVAQRVLPGARRVFITRDTLRPIGRFVIGDGVDAGFSLGHPKLAEFIQDDLFGRGQIVTDSRRAFVDWGRDVVRALNAATMPPENAPEYGLLYYAQHLEDLHPHVDLLYYRELTENGWRAAWMAHEEGFRGFARDLEVVWHRLLVAADGDRRLLKDPNIGLAALIRCLLMLSSIRSIGAAVPPNFMAELVRQDLLSPREALHLARLKSEPQQVATLEALAPLLGKYIDEAESEARAIRTPRLLATALAALARQMSEPRRTTVLAEALEIARVDNSPDIVNRIQAELHPSETSSAPPHPASPVAAGLDRSTGPDDRRRRFEQLRLSTADGDAGLDAILVPGRSGWQIVSDLYGLAARLPEATLTRALDVILSWDAEYDAQNPTGRDRYDRNRGLEALAPYLSDADLRRTFDLATAWGPFDSEQSLKALLPFMSPDLIAHAFDTTLRMEKGYVSRQLIALLLPYLSEELLKTALTAALDESSFDHAELLRILIPRLTDGQLRDVNATILKWDSDMRRSVLPDLAARSPSLIREMANQLSDNVADLDVVLPFMTAVDRAAAVSSAYPAAYQVRDGVAFAATFAAFARRLPGQEAEEAIQLALAAARDVRDDAERAFACLLVACAPQCPDAAAHDLLRDAIGIADTLTARDTQLALRCAIIALGTQLRETEFDELVDSSLTALRNPHLDADSKAAVTLALYSTRLGETKWRAVFDSLVALMGGPHRKDLEESPIYLLLSLVPRLPPQEALAFLDKSREFLDGNANLGIWKALAAISPHVSADDAARYARETLTETGEESGLLSAIVAPYLADAALSDAVVQLLKKSITLPRPQVLATLSVLEGGVPDLIGIRPALSSGNPSRSCLTAVGGPTTLVETMKAVREVRQWWP